MASDGVEVVAGVGGGEVEACVVERGVCSSVTGVLGANAGCGVVEEAGIVMPLNAEER